MARAFQVESGDRMELYVAGRVTFQGTRDFERGLEEPDETVI